MQKVFTQKIWTSLRKDLQLHCSICNCNSAIGHAYAHLCIPYCCMWTQEHTNINEPLLDSLSMLLKSYKQPNKAECYQCMQLSTGFISKLVSHCKHPENVAPLCSGGIYKKILLLSQCMCEGGESIRVGGNRCLQHFHLGSGISIFLETKKFIRSCELEGCDAFLL